MFLRILHDSLNRFFNEFAEAIKAPIPFYSRTILIALSIGCFMLLSSRPLGIPLFLINTISWSTFLGTITLYGLISTLGRSCIFTNIRQFWSDLLRVFRQEQLFWPFFHYYILSAPYRCLASVFDTLDNPLQHALPHTSIKLSSQILGFLVFFYGAAGFSGSLKFISVPILKTVLLSELLLCAAFQFLAFSGRPDFWNTALDSFIAKPTLLDKISFLAMHVFLFPLSNFIQMVRFPQNAEQFERRPAARPIEDERHFPGAGRRANQAAPQLILFPNRQRLTPEQLRAARVNRF